jgi:hypothetical protein
MERRYPVRFGAVQVLYFEHSNSQHITTGFEMTRLDVA